VLPALVLGASGGAGAESRAGAYIVVLHDGANPNSVARDHARLHGAEVTFTYSNALRGYAARIPEARVARVAADPRVDYVEADQVVTVVHHRTNHTGGPGGGDTEPEPTPDPTTCGSPQTLPWGIDRINTLNSHVNGGTCTSPPAGVTVYVIDTGADAAHGDLNVIAHVNYAGGPNKDCHGHGTHVAGTIAARDNTSDVVGAAPGAPIVGVKVLNCAGSGSWSGVIAGIDFVAGDAATRGTKAVANMSLGGGASNAVDDAVRNSVANGVAYAVAAGNSGADACNSSPARAGAGTNNGIITVAATDSSDAEASWSNFGDCVDIWAPGVSVLSTKSGGGTTTMSGTSMASPHAAGVAALLAATTAPADAEAAIVAAAANTDEFSKDGAKIMRLDAATL
jgi:subtilisin family serine protease